MTHARILALSRRFALTDTRDFERMYDAMTADEKGALLSYWKRLPSDQTWQDAFLRMLRVYEVIDGRRCLRGSAATMAEAVELAQRTIRADARIGWLRVLREGADMGSVARRGDELEIHVKGAPAYELEVTT